MFVCPLVMFITFSVIAAEYTVSDSPMTTRKYVDLRRPITLGPTLPAFLSPNVAQVLVDNFGIGGITNVEDDMNLFLGA